MTKPSVSAAWRRIRTIPKLWQKILWWLVRLCFLYGLICTIVWIIFPNDQAPAFSTLLARPEQVDAVKLLIMMLVYLPVCFLWEIFQFLPNKNLFRFVPCYFQNISVLFAWATGFMGAFVNFYYSQYWWDSTIHFFGGGLCVMLGYEMFVAMQKRDKSVVPMNVLLIACAGMGFVIGTGWELFEFIFDQFFGGDTQHWSLQMAIDAGEVHPIFQPAKEYMSADWQARYALMDTMSDIVLNSAGSVAFAIFLRIFHYYHRKKEIPVEFVPEDAVAAK
ncbi:MAG: hypothetical protein LBQ33_03385 [Oscillospiraceae bacterium]|jgi:hypothetical protein|nr:hypothetical protein [Oscillospiraceae bacterium]